MALGKNLSKKIDTDKPHDIEIKSAVALSDDIIENSEQNAEEVQLESLQQFCIFKTNGEEYAIPINLVKEVVPFPPIAPLTQMPAYITGMVNVRGNIYGVLDLGIFFNIKTNQNSESKYLLVLEHEEYQMSIAIPDVPDTLLVADSMIEELSASRLKSVIGQKYLKGIIKKERRMIILFDILGMISGDKFTETS